jgi:hypothetical protein
MADSYCYLVIEQHPYGVPRDEQEMAEMPPGPDSLVPALRAVLGEPGYATRLSHIRETPSRATALDRIVAAGFLEPDEAARLFPDGRITDRAWAILRPFDPEIGPPPARRDPDRGSELKTVRSWSLRILGPADPTPIDIDPLAFPDNTLPLTAIVAALEDLAADGWAVVEVSEDRGIDDAAGRSHVVAQRILLSRSS